MRGIHLPTHGHYIDEGYSEFENESTISLDSGFMDIHLEDGLAHHETYHYQSGKAEKKRLESLHIVFTSAFDGYLHLAPIDWSPQRVLDIGCGTGTWCIEMADSYPGAEVIGVDLKAFQPFLVPPNLSFEIDDVEEEWTWNRSFDYIHARYMAGTICDWPRLIRQCFDNCISGGWVEFQDMDSIYVAHEASVSKEGRILQWLAYSCNINDLSELAIHLDSTFAQWMHGAGFINIHIVKRVLPLDVLAEDLKSEGGLYSETQLHGGPSDMNRESFEDAPGWASGQVDAFIDDIRRDHPSVTLYTVYGQKPIHE